MKLYAERDIIAQGTYYTRHLEAMTAEGLESKSDIAAELAHRDKIISDLLFQKAVLLKILGELEELGSKVQKTLTKLGVK